MVYQRGSSFKSAERSLWYQEIERVCVCEREREREIAFERERERERERESAREKERDIHIERGKKRERERERVRERSSKGKRRSLTLSPHHPTRRQSTPQIAPCSYYSWYIQNWRNPVAVGYK